jgi:hypothetical protein
VGGNGALKVDSVESVSTNGLANNTFENGFKYVFNITAPTNQPWIAMKFADWTGQSAGQTISASGNIRISSLQASTTDPILVTYANTYTTPWMNIVGDLDANTPGRQIKILVETKVPVNTPNGSYSTTYGVRTQ